jgi:IclR family transcriptional regulator, acetate operon repressor
MIVKTANEHKDRGYGAAMPDHNGPNADSTRSVRKALLVLEEVAALHPVTVAALARALDLPKTTVQRNLTTLGEAGWLTQSNADRSWSLSSKLATLTERAVSEFTLQHAATEPMRRLRDATNESVLLIERAGSSAVVLDVASTNHVVQAIAPLGTLLPLHASAGGKALLAASDVEDPALREPLARFTGSTVVDRAELAAELEVIRQRGWAQQSREFEDSVNSVAAAIASADGHSAVAAIVLFGPAIRLAAKTIEQVAPLVVQAATETSHRLHSATPPTSRAVR